MPASLGNVDVTVDGVPLYVQSIDTEVRMDMDGIRVNIEGFLSNMEKERVARTPQQDIRSWVQSQENYGRPADVYAAQYSGSGYPAQERRENLMRDGNTTRGSYAYAVAQLAEGLQAGVNSGWITEDEAKTEFRRNVESVQAADMHKQYEADRIAALEKELAEIREKQAEAESS